MAILMRELFLNEKDKYNFFAKHLVQSWEWGDFKEATGKKVFRYGLFDNQSLQGGFQFTIHPLPSPLNKWNVGYLPKGPLPTPEMLQSLYVFGRQHNCVFIKLEPHVYGPISDPNTQEYLKATRESILKSKDVEVVMGKELFTRYNFLLDLTQTDEQLFANMHEKTRYNIGLAQRKGVTVVEQNDEQGFQIYLKLYFETTKRQGYYGHDEFYHHRVWEVLRSKNMARILIAYYENTPLTAWMLFNFQNTLYYPYGGSTTKHRNVMASNLVAWHAIQLGKRLGCDVLDLWGCLGPNADPLDPYYGFHKFKQGYGPVHIENLGTFDVIVNPTMYKIYTELDKWRSKWLKIKRNI